MADWHSYCDETSTAKPNKYAGVGAIFVNRTVSASVCEAVLEWRGRTGLQGELKWQKVSNKYVIQYRQLIEMVLANAYAGKLAFWCLFVNRADFRHNLLADGCENITYSKLFYQLIRHRGARLLNRGDTIRIFPDKKHPPVDYSDLHRSLDYVMRNQLDQLAPVVLQTEEICSKLTHFGQINDILLGAASWHVNQRHLRECKSNPKNWLANEIAKMAGVRDLSENVRRERREFGVWRFEYRSAIKKGQTKPSRQPASPNQRGPNVS